MTFQYEVNEILEKYARANDGTNHFSSYALDMLPAADSLLISLELYFAEDGTSKAPVCSGKSWDIQTIEVDRPDDVLFKAAQHWFFGLRSSPRLFLSAAEEEEVLNFVIKLRKVVGDAALFEVKVSPPPAVWYECLWQDFAFDGPEKRWLLHLGFSD